ncbi:hypothetical protein [Kutzneria sp. 744]|uniref:hypothetical protein n=1 Tax=Kutzneria sp. (strain 744) TaxID=345341 RepID=UPI0003EEA92C|nr:hypothetical protein [Kutzneria sp. 744]EWM19686.1 hypothetical protein KUTG_09990 [Kutzneria sp. 744]
MPETTLDDPWLLGAYGQPNPDSTASTREHTDGALRCDDEEARCARCGGCAATTGRTVDDDDVCDSCAARHYTRCESCDLLVVDDEVENAADDTELCGSCANSRYWSCEYCDSLINRGDHCDSCARDLSADGVIQSYDYTPEPDFHGEGPSYFGIELELSANSGHLRRCADLAAQRLGDVGYLKKDDSINYGSGYGFELVTHPMSYPWAMENFPWDILEELDRNGCSGGGNGLHVHLSRAAFGSATHSYRWMQFLYRNAGQVITVARRVSDEWAAFHEADRRRVKDYAKGARDGGRYRAINTGNVDTFELRMFASSLKRQEVQAALALASASVEYTRVLSVSDIVRRGGWTWAAFTVWLQERPEYAPLAREIDERSCAC